MERIASFCVDHNTLVPGMYLSRKDGDVLTWDIRMKTPNKGSYLSPACAHTIEHLFATYARNSKWSEHVIYVGPMGCLTGFYLLTRGLTDAEALARGWETHLTLVTEALVPTEALFPLVNRLADKANTQLSIITEVLAGAWERLETGRADIVIAPDMHFRSSSEINSRKLYSVMNVYVAAPNHPIHQEPEPLSEVTRVKYRGVAVADTARERPVLTVQLLDKQPRLTVTSLEDKRQALLAGLGVATMPYPFVEKDIAEGRLRVVSPEYSHEVDIIMAWRRDSMGEAKSWCLREIPKLFTQYNK